MGKNRTRRNDNKCRITSYNVCYTKLLRDDRIEVINEDVRYFKRGNFYDFVVTNPPYMKLEGGRINTDPMKAVSRHEIKLTLEELIESSKRLLKPA